MAKSRTRQNVPEPSDSTAGHSSIQKWAVGIGTLGSMYHDVDGDVQVYRHSVR